MDLVPTLKGKRNSFYLKGKEKGNGIIITSLEKLRSTIVICFAWKKGKGTGVGFTF